MRVVRLGDPSYSRLGKPPGIADTQSPRISLLDIGWITGFVDGEGCFCDQSDSLIEWAARDTRTGLQLAHEFAVTQGARSVDSLHMLANFFGVGAVYINRRYDNAQGARLSGSVSGNAY